MVLRRSLLLLIALLLPAIAFATTKHIVKKGDNLYDLSRKYGVSVEDLKTFNKLSNIDLGIGDELLIPVSNKDGNNNYVVKSGDTISQIAEKFGIKTKDLKSANKLKNDNLRIGQSLYIPLQKNAAPEVVVSEKTIEIESIEKETISSPEVKKEEISNVYIVKKGDTLGEIAEKHNVKTSNLKKANNLKNHNLQIGQKLAIPGQEAIPTEVSATKELAKPSKSDLPTNKKNTSESATVSNVYVIKKGDTIYDLSNKFKISKDNLKKWNNLSNNNLNIGKKLYLTPNKEATIAAKNKSKPKYTETYKVKGGDTLGHIAEKFDTSVSNLKAANDLNNNNLSVGKVLKVPTIAKHNSKTAKKSDPKHSRTTTTKYTVKKGDTLGGIANRHKVTVAKIKESSSLKNNNIKVGQVLLIPGNKVAPAKKLSGSKYTVVSGDTLGGIGDKFDVSVKELKNANNLRSNNIRVGMKLVVPGYTKVASTPTQKTQKSSKTINSKYIVKKGDTLGLIAQGHGLSISSIKSVNNIKGNNIRTGQIIVLPGVKPNYSEQQNKTASRSQSPSNSHPSKLKAKESIITVAKQYLGAPYKFGGYSFKTGIDCSGYVKKIFSKFNVELPRTARDIYYNAGIRVSKSQLQVGDLVFFRTYASYPSHVGIYMGNNLFIHASSGARKVAITRLDKKYYTKRYIGAKRIQLSAIFEKEYSQR
ncbi:MAG: hypothetical protein DHS20C13_20930 [Thermodesulfobacteriota bacterium]|nr:MAG: hypothetical protein DHS20C13_20930 [Thermodesulfobacteriota bacterium]